MKTKVSIIESSWVSELSWSDVEKKIELGAAAVLPIGASAKEHGLHLPMNTDYLQAKWLADQLILKRNLLVWPIINYGFYPAFINYPGSVTLSQATFELMIKEVISSIFTSGVDRLVLLNTGISTIRPLEYICREFPGDVSLINVYNGKHYKKIHTRIVQQSEGGHADESETSIMLAINKSLVDMNLASGSMQACSRPGVLNRNDPESLNYSPTGACGAPQHASSEKGVQLLQAMLEDINQQLSDFGFSVD